MQPKEYFVGEFSIESDDFQFLDADGNPFKPETPVHYKLVGEDGTVLKEGTLQDSNVISIKDIKKPRKFSVIVESYSVSDPEGFKFLDSDEQENIDESQENTSLNPEESQMEPDEGDSEGDIFELLDANGNPFKPDKPVHYEIIGEDGKVLKEGTLSGDNTISLKDIGTSKFSFYIDNYEGFDYSDSEIDESESAEDETTEDANSDSDE
jgi:hypothetical protein